METTTNKKLHAKLKRVLAEDGTILFIGSGVSVWSELPNWGQLLDKMAEFVEQKGLDASNIRYYSKSQPLLAADFGCAALPTNDFRTFIHSACKKDAARPSIIHQQLINLGVSCYITTNYDRLLEQALEENEILNRFKVVTNREPTDCAGLLHLRRRNFIFKPHGDIEHLESIVLSNRHYNDLYENGAKHYTYRALETLFTTRDVVFVGFGLTDPDFMRIIGKIRNEFRTNLNTHYAIMPDISQTARDYWAENCGIQILSYPTKETKNGRDHSALLELLGSLVTKSRKPAILTAVTQNRENTRITKRQRVALHRYTQYIMQQFKTPDGPVFPLEFQCHKYGRPYKLDVEKVLSDDIQNFILTGNPGAGKTFFLKQYCLVQARRLQEWCEQNKTGKLPKIPVYIDLKNYSGKDSLKTLIESQFPEEIPIIQWIEEEKVFLLFDSFNEVEKKYLDNNSCAQEIRRYSYYADIVIATRFKDAIDLCSLEYRLKDVKEEFVLEYLENQGIAVSIDEEEMILRFLQNPLMFQLLAQGKIRIDNKITTKCIYESYFKYLQTEMVKGSGREIDLISILDSFAYSMVKSGTQSFTSEAIEELLSKKIPEFETEERKTLINYLIDAQQFLIPNSSKNLSFFHQTITEFLAGHFFANQYKRNPDILKEKLQYMRWNFVLLFAVGFLPKTQAEKYMKTLLRTDSLLAVEACSYVEQGTNQMVTLVLEYLIKNSDGKDFLYKIDLKELLKKLPVTKTHEDLLRQLMLDKDIIGGAAADCLLRACGDDVKDELLEEMFQSLDESDRYNYLTSIGEALSDKISIKDFAAVTLRLGRAKITQDEEEEPIISGFDSLADYLPLPQVIEIFQSVGQLNVLQQNLLVDILKNEESQEGFDICTNLIRQGWEEAIFSFYMYVRFDNNVSLNNIEESFVEYLLPGLRGEKNKWIIALIYELYQKCQPFARGIRARLRRSRGITRLTYLYAIGKNRKKSFFSHYRSMLYYRKLPQKLIGAFDQVDWKEEADHIIKFLIRQDRLPDLCKYLDESFDRTRWYYLSLNTFLKLVKTIEARECSTVTEDDSWTKHTIGKFIANHVDREDLLNLYGITNEGIKRFFNFFVFNNIEELKIEDFSESEIDFMLEDIKYYDFEDIVYEDKILLANIASEEFISNRLKSLLNTDNACLKENIRQILEIAGANHARRYIEQ
ncbi:SIR2 family protein [Desulfosporosinus fructosivorans]